MTEAIQVQGFGETTEMTAAEIVAGDTVQAVILEPTDRDSFDESREQAFRAAVREMVSDFEDMPDSIIFDPARDNQTSERV